MPYSHPFPIPVIPTILNFIVQKGRSADLIKPSASRKRKRSEMEEVK